jgi:nitrate reductase beta subunit
MKKMRKITVRVPVDLLAAAQMETGAGITETVRKGLEMLRRARAYRQMEKLRGKVKFDLSLDELRNDRR